MAKAASEDPTLKKNLHVFKFEASKKYLEPWTFVTKRFAQKLCFMKSFPDARQCSQADSQAWGSRWGSEVVQTVTVLKVCWLWSQLWIQILIPPATTCYARISSLLWNWFLYLWLGCTGKTSAAHGGWDLWSQIQEEQRNSLRKGSRHLELVVIRAVCSNVILGYNCSRVIQEQQQSFADKNPVLPSSAKWPQPGHFTPNLSFSSVVWNQCLLSGTFWWGPGDSQFLPPVLS